MSRKNQQKLLLQERDRALFQFLGQHETALFQQIKVKFWPHSVTNQTPQDRLDKLRRAGYLERYDYQLDPQTKVSRYGLKKAALKELDAERASGLYTGKLIEREVEQAVAGVQARLELERQGQLVVGWVSERRLQQTQQRKLAQARSAQEPLERDPIADGQALIADAVTGSIEAVDVEIDGQYYGQMLDRKLAEFRGNGRQVVWATSAARAPRLQQAAATAPNITIIVAL